MRESERNGKGVDAEILGLQALGWVMADGSRAQRLLDMTGLTADALRSGLGDSAILGAVLAFLAAHEPDLVACSEALDQPPEALIAAQQALA